MRLHAYDGSERSLAEDVEEHVGHDTPTMEARHTPATEDEGLEEPSEGVKICKACMTSHPGDGEYCVKCGEELVTIRKVEDSYVGQEIAGKYKVVERIGKGGMGEVYLGVNEELGQKVAIKFLSKRFVNDESIAARFFNEAKSSSKVSHPNAVTFFEFGQHDDGTLFIITEFIEGKSLTQTLKDAGPLEADLVLTLGIQVCEVLSKAHEQGVIHRDLKPDNLMLMPTGRNRFQVKVLDFGIAKIIDDEGGPNTETGSVFGTPEFMSPEQAKGEGADPRSDIYAMGIILFYMLTGKLPFRGKNKLVVLNNQANKPPPRPSDMRDDVDVPLKLEAVILKCLNKDRSARYQSADDLLEALEELRLPGGSSTSKLGLSEGDDAEEIDSAELGPNEIRANTVRLGATGQEPDPHADTLAAEFDDSPVAADLQSVEMWREHPSDRMTTATSAPRSRGLVWAVVAVSLVVVVGGLWFALSGPGETESATSGAADVNIEQVLVQGQVIGLLAAAEDMLREGNLEAASRSMETSRLWLSDGELPEEARKRRERLEERLEELSGVRSDVNAALAAGRCSEAEGFVGDVREVSPGLADQMRSKVESCEAGGAPPATERAPKRSGGRGKRPSAKKPAPQPEPEREAEPQPEPDPEPPAPEDGEPPAEPDPVEKATPPTKVTDPPVEGASGEGEEKADEPGDESADGKKEAAGDDVPDGMALPPKKLD